MIKDIEKSIGSGKTVTVRVRVKGNQHTPFRRLALVVHPWHTLPARVTICAELEDSETGHLRRLFEFGPIFGTVDHAVSRAVEKLNGYLQRHWGQEITGLTLAQ